MTERDALYTRFGRAVADTARRASGFLSSPNFQSFFWAAVMRFSFTAQKGALAGACVTLNLEGRLYTVVAVYPSVWPRRLVTRCASSWPASQRGWRVVGSSSTQTMARSASSSHSGLVGCRRPARSLSRC